MGFVYEGVGSERASFTMHYLPSAPIAPAAREAYLHSSNRQNSNTSALNLERESLANKRSHTNPEQSQPAASGSGSSLLRAQNLSNLNSSRKNIVDEDDFRVPTFVNSGIAPSSDEGQQSVVRSSSLAKSHPSIQLRQEHIDPNISNPKRNKVNDSRLHQTTGKESAKEATQNSRLWLDSREKTAELLTIPNTSCYGNHIVAALNEPKDSSNRNLMPSQEQYGNHRLQTNHSSNYEERQNIAEVLDGSNILNPKLADDNRDGVDKLAGSISGADTGKSSDGSETSMVDSESGYDLSPDDVVGLVGPKHFWKSRRAIINQQRVFAAQVFELHRLIKVQKLIAGSPNILVEGSPLVPRSSKTPAKRAAPENTIRPQQAVKQKDDFNKVINVEHMMETAPGPPPVPSEDGLNNWQPPTARQSLQNEQCPGNLSPAASTGAENRLPGPWCFPASGNQWLMPVMSPSEGLIYKPVMGPFPPSAGFMGHPFGACGPLAAPQIMGDFMNMAYGIPASHQPNVGIVPGPGAISPGYFPAPYGIPVMNPNPGISSSTAQQVSTFTDAGVRGDSDENSRSSGNLPTLQSKALPHIVQKVQTSRATSAGNNLKGSSASSRNEGRGARGRTEISAASFPMALPDLEDSMPSIDAHIEICAPRVIKVVPYNRRAAPETAARIFQSIQEERLQIS